MGQDRTGPDDSGMCWPIYHAHEPLCAYFVHPFACALHAPPSCAPILDGTGYDKSAILAEIPRTKKKFQPHSCPPGTLHKWWAKRETRKFLSLNETSFAFPSCIVTVENAGRQYGHTRSEVLKYFIENQTTLHAAHLGKTHNRMRASVCGTK